MEDSYTTTTISKNIVLTPKQLDKKIDDNILSQFREQFEGKCIAEGYVKPGSVKLVKRTVGMSNPNHFTGNISFDVLFKIDVCNPFPGNVIECSVDKLNELGVLSVMGPMQIIIPKGLHEDKSPFKEMRVGDKIKVSVIAKRFDLYDTKIHVTARLTTEVGKEIKLTEEKEVKEEKEAELPIEEDEFSEADIDEADIAEDSLTEEIESGSDGERSVFTDTDDPDDVEAEQDITDKENIKEIQLNQEEFDYNSD